MLYSQIEIAGACEEDSWRFSNDAVGARARFVMSQVEAELTELAEAIESAKAAEVATHHPKLAEANTIV